MKRVRFIHVFLSAFLLVSCAQENFGLGGSGVCNGHSDSQESEAGGSGVCNGQMTLALGNIVVWLDIALGFTVHIQRAEEDDLGGDSSQSGSGVRSGQVYIGGSQFPFPERGSNPPKKSLSIVNGTYDLVLPSGAMANVSVACRSQRSSVSQLLIDSSQGQQCEALNFDSSIEGLDCSSTNSISAYLAHEDEAATCLVTFKGETDSVSDFNYVGRVLRSAEPRTEN